MQDKEKLFDSICDEIERYMKEGWSFPYSCGLAGGKNIYQTHAPIKRFPRFMDIRKRYRQDKKKSKNYEPCEESTILSYSTPILPKSQED